MHGSIWFHWRGDDYLAARTCTISGVDITCKVSIPSTDVIQLTLTLEMTTAQVVETSVTVNNNSPIQDDFHPDDQTQHTYEMTPGFKPFTKQEELANFSFISEISRLPFPYLGCLLMLGKVLLFI